MSLASSKILPLQHSAIHPKETAHLGHLPHFSLRSGMNLLWPGRSYRLPTTPIGSTVLTPQVSKPHCLTASIGLLRRTSLLLRLAEMLQQPQAGVRSVPVRDVSVVRVPPARLCASVS